MIKGIIIYIAIAGLIILIGNKLGKKNWFKILELAVFVIATIFMISEAIKISSAPTSNNGIIIEEITEEEE